MRITISISHVSGDAACSIQTTDLDLANDFLSKNDHEGSSVSMQVVLETGEETYKLLHLIQEYSK